MTDPTRRPGLLPRLAAAAESDHALLARFAAGRDEAAFATLVARHGPTVLGVCRRLLGDAHAAEDAAQATFLVLARHAARVGTAPVTAWLHATARRVAANARRTARRKPQPASLAADPAATAPDPAGEAAGRELLAVLEREITRLPDAYRLPVVLCCVDGLSQDEAARRLGCTPGAIRGRLERGRARLAARLVRSGIPLPVALAAAAAARGEMAAAPAAMARAAAAFADGRAVPAGGIRPAAVAQAHGGLHVLDVRKWLVPTVVVLIAAALLPAAVFGGRPHDTPPPRAAAGARQPDDREADPPVPAPADGLYTWEEAGPGTRVRRNDGAEVVLAGRLGGGFGAATMYAVVNDNTRFRVELKGAGPIPPAPAGGQRLVIVAGGVAMGVWSQSDRRADGTIDVAMDVGGAGPARAVAAALKVEPARRSHPGHRLETTLTPEKAEYRAGEPVTVVMTITNRGTGPVAFRTGGQQRGARDNQFRFLAYRSAGHGRAVPDTGDPTNFGGKGGVRVLRPGESYTAKASLDGWFAFTDPDTYRVTGLYELDLHRSDSAGGGGRETIWTDLATADCVVKVAAGR
ncbi:MAG TPA: sigma-70 family RNA polymerase sigma factor [Urbifossiella sp.]|nr:sigma-70 family RNA polymerase sigma factor [Urbifossiella sp.]